MRRKTVALTTMMTGLVGTTGITACTATPGDRVIAVAKHEVHEQCPLLAAHPSALVVTTQAQWSQLLAKARMLPPLYEAKDTDFTRQSIVLVALPTTPTPMTVSLAGPDAVRFNDTEQRLDITLRVMRPADSADTRRAAVMASPCVLAWVTALPGLRGVVARSTDGQVIAQSLPQTP